MMPKYYKDSEPCSHRGCLAHISHPCDGCGRIGGRGEAFEGEGQAIKDFKPARTAIQKAVDACPKKVTLKQAQKQIAEFNKLRKK